MPATSKPVVPGDLFARHQTIAGLRALADFLEATPDVPVAEYGREYTLYTRDCHDTCGRAEVDRIAALLGVPVTDDTDRDGHYTAERAFGRIVYRIVHIPARRTAEYEARNSYRDNITLDPTPDTDHHPTGHAPATGRVA